MIVRIKKEPPDFRGLFFDANFRENSTEREGGRMSEKAAGWSREQAESRYIGSDVTLRALAEEAGVPFKTLSRWCKAGEWVKKREKINRRALKKAATQAVNRKAKELIKLLEASDEIEDALLMAAKALRATMETDEDGTELMDGRFRAGNLGQVVNAVGRQAETRMLLNGILTAEAREKIAIMKRKQLLEEQEAKEGGGAGEIRVILTKDAEELAQ